MTSQKLIGILESSQHAGTPQMIIIDIMNPRLDLDRLNSA